MIEVISPGLHSSVQGPEVHGRARWGISAGGAADQISFRLGNRLVGNTEDAAALEMTLMGAVLRFTRNSLVALTGADFGAKLDGLTVPCWRTIIARRGQVLECGVARQGARGYLCVSGGLERAAVVKGATIGCAGAARGAPFRVVRGGWLERFAPGRVLRVTAGPDAEGFPAESRAVFFSSSYAVGEGSNRAGLRLQGQRVQPPFDGGMTTEGVSLGAVQVPSSGQPIILFVDQQTTGGYPVIANVITADLRSVAQLRPRDVIRFELITLDRARELLLELEASMESEALEP